MGVMEQQVAGSQPLVALLGNPNCGKTALFNRLTGARQKVANYAGVTIERKEGAFTSPGGRHYRVLDLPGAYSLSAQTPDEAITREYDGSVTTKTLTSAALARSITVCGLTVSPTGKPSVTTSTARFRFCDMRP